AGRMCLERRTALVVCAASKGGRIKESKNARISLLVMIKNDSSPSIARYQFPSGVVAVTGGLAGKFQPATGSGCSGSNGFTSCNRNLAIANPFALIPSTTERASSYAP